MVVRIKKYLPIPFILLCLFLFASESIQTFNNYGGVKDACYGNQSVANTLHQDPKFIYENVKILDNQNSLFCIGKLKNKINTNIIFYNSDLSKFVLFNLPFLLVYFRRTLESRSLNLIFSFFILSKFLIGKNVFFVILVVVYINILAEQLDRIKLKKNIFNNLIVLVFCVNSFLIFYLSTGQYYLIFLFLSNFLLISNNSKNRYLVINSLICFLLFFNNNFIEVFSNGYEFIEGYPYTYRYFISTQIKRDIFLVYPLLVAIKFVYEK